MTEQLKPETISDVQVGDYKLTKRLLWTQEGNRVYAKPKGSLPRGVFKIILRKFRAMGGDWTGRQRGFTVELKPGEK